jgi:hypothetical protein
VIALIMSWLGCSREAQSGMQGWSFCGVQRIKLPASTAGAEEVGARDIKK